MIVILAGKTVKGNVTINVADNENDLEKKG